MTLKNVNVNRRVETLTKAVVTEKEVEDDKASVVDMDFILETSQTLDNQADVADVKVEEEVKVEEVNFVVEDEIAKIIVEETHFMIKDERDEAIEEEEVEDSVPMYGINGEEEFIEKAEEGDNSKVKIVETVEAIMEENNFGYMGKIV